MTDLTNNLTIDEKKSLALKYEPVLSVTGITDKDELFNIAFLLEKTVGYVNDIYSNLTTDWKTWITVLIKNMYLEDMIASDTDIFRYIDLFVGYLNTHYLAYVDDTVSINDFARDFGFVRSFISKEKGN